MSFPFKHAGVNAYTQVTGPSAAVLDGQVQFQHRDVPVPVKMPQLNIIPFTSLRYKFTIHRCCRQRAYALFAELV